MRMLAHVAYLAAALCFALPFFDCVREEKLLIHFTGLELAIGTTFQRPLQVGATRLEIGHVPALSSAYVALASLAIATGLFWMKGRVGTRIAFFVGASAKLALVMLPLEFVGKILPRFPGAGFHYDPAFWCSLTLIGLGIGLSAVTLWGKTGKSAP